MNSSHLRVVLRRAFGLAVACIIVFPANILAAEAPAAAEGAGRGEAAAAAPLPVVLSPGPYYIGATISATIVVPAAVERPQLDLGRIRDFEARIFDAAPLPDSAAQRGFAFRLNLLPKKAGTLRLPALSVGGTAQRLTTAPVELEVVEPKPSPDMSLTATLSETTCYVGQPITLEVTWTLGADISTVQAVDLRVPLLEHADYKHRDFAALPKDFGTAIGLPVSNGRIIGGVNGATIRFRQIIVPQKAGTFTVAGANVLCSVAAAPTQRRNGLGPGFQYAPQYDNQFFSDAQSVNAPRLYARSAPIKVRVLPLPAAGQPPDFSGIVGAFALSATVEPATVREGEPLTLTVRTRDYAYPEVLDLPPFARLPGFRGRFRIPADRAAPTVEETAGGPEKIFRQSFRAVSTGVDKVPALAIAFFDPVTKAYRTATAPETPLRVLPHAIATGFDAILSDGSRLKNILVAKRAGIGPNFSPAELRRAPVDRWTDTTGFWWVTLGLPPFLCGAVIRLTRRRRCRRESPAREQALWAYPDFLDATRRAVDPEGLTAAVRTYLQRRLGIGVVTFGAVEARLRAQGVTESELQRLRAWFEAGDRREFAPPAPGVIDAGFSRDAARALVGAIEATFTARGVRRGAIPGAWLTVMMVGWFAVAAPLLIAALPGDALGEAERWFQAGIAQQFDDPDAAKEAFRKSAAGFDYLLGLAEPGTDRGKLHYNTGAARFFAGDFGAAVYHFKTARRLLPADPRVRAALAYVRSQQPDVVLRTPGRRFAEAVAAVQDFLAPDVRRLLLASAYAAVWGLIAVGAFWPSGVLRRALLAPLLLGLAVGVSLIAEQWSARGPREGVVLESEVVPRRGPAAIYEAAFETPLHAGAEFRLTRQSNEWWEIALPGAAESCWIPAASARIIGR